MAEEKTGEIEVEEIPGSSTAPSGEKTTYLSIPLLELVSEKNFPGNLYLCLHHKMVCYKNAGDSLTADLFNKLVYSHVKYVFIKESDREAYTIWLKQCREEDEKPFEGKPEAVAEAKPIVDSALDQRRKMMDLFESPRDDKQVQAAVESSKRLVTEFLRKPYAVNNIMLLQKYSKGVVDHSVNVSVLSTFLGLRMGYTHQGILENLALGGLFHDIGKSMLESKGDLVPDEEDPSLQQHPKLGAEMVEKLKDVPNEVRLIVAQHHEFLDGTGYPAKLKGLAIYDLARVVAIANTYDNLISQSFGATLKERAAEAVDQLERDFNGKLDPKKLEKAIKILRYSFL